MTNLLIEKGFIFKDVNKRKELFPDCNLQK